MPDTTIIKYPLDRLLEDYESLFRVGIFKKLSTKAQYDIRECCKCIAFDLPTSAAFHILRAAEEVLRKYYSKIYPKDKRKIITM